MENLYGVKVLYRPLNYDYDVGSGAEPGQKNDYYGIYAFQILSYLYNIYGIPDTDYSILKNIFKIQNTPLLDGVIKLSQKASKIQEL